MPDGVDRCPTTVAGAAVDERGCSQDSDGDNIADGLDRCPDTPAGVLVDPHGCPKDSDGDKIPDGLDRCSETPRGATVDALGCPGDEDGDAVLDGLDRCPRTRGRRDGQRDRLRGGTGTRRSGTRGSARRSAGHRSPILRRSRSSPGCPAPAPAGRRFGYSRTQSAVRCLVRT